MMTIMVVAICGSIGAGPLAVIVVGVEVMMDGDHLPETGAMEALGVVDPLEVETVQAEMLAVEEMVAMVAAVEVAAEDVAAAVAVVEISIYQQYLLYLNFSNLLKKSP